MPNEIRPCLRNIGPLGKSFSPPTIVFWNRMKLRQIESDNSDLVKIVYLALPPLRKLLLIANHAARLEPFVNIVRTDAQMMDSDRARIVHDPQSLLTEAESEI